jgi:hypothetical protein
VEKDLKAVTGILKTDVRLADFLNDPSVKKPVREQFFRRKEDAIFGLIKDGIFSLFCVADGRQVG